MNVGLRASRISSSFMPGRDRNGDAEAARMEILGNRSFPPRLERAPSKNQPGASRVTLAETACCQRAGSPDDSRRAGRMHLALASIPRARPDARIDRKRSET